MKYFRSVLGLCGLVVLLFSIPVQGFAEAKTLSWAGCGISKKAFMKEIAIAFEKKTGIKIELKGGGATRGIREVANRTRDLGGACRYTLENPLNLSSHPAERRVRMDPVAWDALAVLVHRDNPINDISLKQIRQIYTGKITNWKQLGGNDAPVELIVRKGKISGVGRTIRELIFANYDQEFTPRAKVVRSSGPLEKAIAKDAVNAIGISGISSARKRKVKLLKLQGKSPTYENIRNGDYLLYRPLFLVTHLQNRDPDVRRFSNFVHSEEGRKIIRSVGTVPYGDAIGLWIKYLEQVARAQKAGLRQ
ncbi:MAG: phosphate ABC transporter substrate-binding protein PstS [Gammaproteobacteria bacterium]|nr:MAG: phosphate ABC transporter substrate-binding protein PstS [Gammaproteobacteria bacterium]